MSSKTNKEQTGTNCDPHPPPFPVPRGGEEVAKRGLGKRGGWGKIYLGSC